MNVLDRVRRTIRQHQLLSSSTRVVVALSGGSDSVALAHLLIELDRAGEARVAGLAHFNHQLRADADADEKFCAALAASLDCRFISDRGDVRDLARRERRSVEDAARALRHAFLERARLQMDADVIALGHTRDDQAETFLLRLLRGAGARGLAAMHPRRGAVVRPLLDCRRADLRTYLEARGASFVHDSSNDDVGVPRNRVRAELLPFLERRFNPAVIDALADEADLAREEWLWMESAAASAAEHLVRSSGDESRIDAAGLGALPTAQARMVLHRSLTDRSGGRAVRFAHVETVLRLAREGGPPVDLPGQRVERIGSAVVLRSRPSGQRGVRKSNLFWYPLSIPGEVRIAEAGWTVSAERVSSISASPEAAAVRAGAGAGNVGGDDAIAVVQFAGPDGPLAVRNRRPGDRFRPLGLGGSKKVQDFFVDRKVARHTRDTVPLVVDGADRIVWVGGLAIDERFRVTDPAQAVVVLRLRQA
jgi:tRNA(Ile)-lysidine synthase